MTDMLKSIKSIKNLYNMSIGTKKAPRTVKRETQRAPRTLKRKR